MSTVQTVYSALQQAGYRPMIGEGSAVTFRYFGQVAQVSYREIGALTIAEVECNIPRPLPSSAQAAAFAASHPLAQLSGQGGSTVLRLATLLPPTEATVQVTALLQLLDTYAADAAFGTNWSETDPKRQGVERQSREEAQQPSTQISKSESQGEVNARENGQLPKQPESQTQAPAMGISQVATEASQAVAEPRELSSEWAQVRDLMHERFHPLAEALAGLGAPAPDEVQMDMMQGQQVRGTAIMMWGSPPDAVVVCEQGQVIPSGYRGGTWASHQTAQQIAAETFAHLQALRKA